VAKCHTNTRNSPEVEGRATCQANTSIGEPFLQKRPSLSFFFFGCWKWYFCGCYLWVTVRLQCWWELSGALQCFFFVWLLGRWGLSSLLCGYLLLLLFFFFLRRGSYRQGLGLALENDFILSLHLDRTVDISCLEEKETRGILRGTQVYSFSVFFLFLLAQVISIFRLGKEGSEACSPFQFLLDCSFSFQRSTSSFQSLLLDFSISLCCSPVRSATGRERRTAQSSTLKSINSSAQATASFFFFLQHAKGFSSLCCSPVRGPTASFSFFFWFWLSRDPCVYINRLTLVKACIDWLSKPMLQYIN